MEQGAAMTGIGARLRTNEAEVFRDIDRFVDQAQRVAVPRALKRLADMAETEGLRKISEIYGLGPRKFRAGGYLSRKIATATELAETITVKGKGLPLYDFIVGPKLPGKGNRRAVRVRVKGRTITLPHAFIATMPSGHVGVFARGAYGGRGVLVATSALGRFTFGRGRRKRRADRQWTELPINELFTFGPAEAFSNPIVRDAMRARVDDAMPGVMLQQFRFARLTQ